MFSRSSDQAVPRHEFERLAAEHNGADGAQTERPSAQGEVSLYWLHSCIVRLAHSASAAGRTSRPRTRSRRALHEDRVPRDRGSRRTVRRWRRRAGRRRTRACASATSPSGTGRRSLSRRTALALPCGRRAAPRLGRRALSRRGLRVPRFVRGRPPRRAGCRAADRRTGPPCGFPCCRCGPQRGPGHP